MAFEKKLFGVMPDGKEVEQYILTNDNGVSASFLTLGGIWHSMIVPDRNGAMNDVVLGYDNVEKCLTYPSHLGEIVGRNANRIGGAQFILNETGYQLEANNGLNNLHSGPNYYSYRLWHAEVSETSLGTTITFSLSSPDGDQGYPGNAEIYVSYTLTPDDSLMINYRMVSDQDTIANMTNHSYFNLAGHQSGEAVDQIVWIDADTFTYADQTSIPTGEFRSVAGTPMDFRTPKPIAQDIDADYDQLNWASGFDHNWVLNHPAGELSLCAKAVDPVSERVMEVYTDLPGVQFYTGNFLSGQYEGKDGVKYGKRFGYCFETQYYPDAINKPEFPSPLLKAGEEYNTTTIYKFYCLNQTEV